VILNEVASCDDTRRASPPAKQEPFGAWIMVAALVLLQAPMAQVFGAPPTLTHQFPAGAKRGTKVTVTCAGAFAWPVMVRAPGLDVTVAAESGKLDVAIPEDLAADRAWIRLYTAEGASAALPFLIGSYNEIAEKEPNNTPSAAQALAETNVTINGLLEGADVDGFAVTLSAGQTLVATLDANGRLGSPMDAMMQIVSPDGIVLAENNDDVDLDPRIVFTAPKAGTYIVRLFAFPSAPDTTIAFRGGANYIYRLTLATGPYISHAIPQSATLSSGQPAAAGDVEIFGWNIPAGTKLPVVGFGGARLAEAPEFEALADLRNMSEARVGIAFAPNLGGAARVRLVPQGAVPGVAQTDKANPPVLAVPTTVTGWLRKPKQTDVYRLPLKKGQQALVVLEARSAGFPLDPVLKLAGPKGNVVAAVDDPALVRAAIIGHTAAEEGDYSVEVADRYRQGGERCFYRLTVRLEEPDFELTGAADTLTVAPDKPTEFVVNVQRRGPAEAAVGPITIEAVGLPPGVAAAPVISEPTGPSAAKVTLSFTTTGPAFSGPIRIQGKSAQPKEISRFVRTPVTFGATFESFWLTAIAK
jgi:Bacterial pre-peptidase C-terminal domain